MPFKKKTQKNNKKEMKLQTSLLEYFTYHDKFYSGLRQESYLFTNLGFTLSDYIEARLEAQLRDPMGEDLAVAAGINVIEAAARRQNKMRQMAC
tara:strand:+ start:6123 stop:6404 length:282 start_codon:yes stop_codon:yes gene_type:complete